MLQGKNFQKIKAFLKQKEGRLWLSGLPLSAVAFLFSRYSFPEKVVFLTSTKQRAESLSRALSFFSSRPVKLFPAPEAPPFASVYPEPEVSAERVAALYHLLEPGKVFVVASVEAVMQRTLPPEILRTHYEYLLAGEEINREALIKRFLLLGYEKTGLVQRPGEFAVRGGVIDIYGPYHEYPLRLDFFGDQIESIKLFDPLTQRSQEGVEEAVILPVREILFPEDPQELEERIISRAEALGLPREKLEGYLKALETSHLLDPEPLWLPLVYTKPATIFDYFREETLLILIEPEEIADQAAFWAEKIEYGWRRGRESKRLLVEAQESFLSQEELQKILEKAPFSLFIRSLPVFEQEGVIFEVKDHRAHLDQVRLRLKEALSLGISFLQERVEAGEHIIITTSQERSAEQLKGLLGRKLGEKEIPIKSPPLEDLDLQRQIEIYLGDLPQGFFWPELNLNIIPEHELFGGRRALVARRKKTARDTFLRFEDLKPGDYVVHREHGIGLYRGLVSLELGGLPGEFLLIEYQGGDKLYLPVDRLSLLHKYVGIEGKAPKLDRLGGRHFEARKQKVKKAIEEVAQELLTLYAARKVQKGYAFSPPGPLLRQLETSFPFEETPDQAAAIEETLADMQKPTPMDRLICGDVGYGKTEVALRAATLAIENGKQVAVLVPTTVLAEQHYQTFRVRLGPLGVRIGVLSRLKSPSAQKETVQKLAAGELDVVIGTHRLLSTDVSFKDLGLLIIDEEHRFGVRHKERLKQLKKNVDVLALSATPIPRTLQLSLLGIRDLSVITTPPEDRLPVKTFLARFEPEVIKEAIEREIDRGGQVFFVHNRIKGIYALADWLRRLVPRARIEVAHGRTPPQILEEIMVRFVRREIDVLVCTTIVESGLDIPSVNTIIINRADRLGLAEIYQLRGRVGRSNTQAYAYLLVPSLSALSEEAERRLKALMQFTELGSGFKLAMSDLQIRGAGNLLGTAQSGHIAAVGYDLYLEILQRTVEELQGRSVPEAIEPEVNIKVPAFFPETYVPDVEQRLHLYRQLALLQEVEEVWAFKEELIDRFGDLPPEAENLIKLSVVKIYLRELGVRKLDRRGQELIFFFAPELPLPERAIRRLSKKRRHVRLTKDRKLHIRLEGEILLDEVLEILADLVGEDYLSKPPTETISLVHQEAL